MKKAWKVSASILMAACLLFALAACGGGASSTAASAAPAQAGSENATAATYKIGFSPMDLSNPYFVDVVRGAQEYCDEMGYELIVRDPQSDTSKQVTAIEDFVAAGCDAIAMCALDNAAPEAAVKSAVAQGIPVIIESIEVEGATASVLIDEHDFGYALGEVAGKWSAEMYPGEAVEFAVLTQPTLPTVIYRAEGIEDGVIEANPNAVCVIEEAAWLPDSGMKAAENILQAHPNVRMILGINDSGAIGAYEAVMAAGYTTPDVFFVGGCDGTDEALEKIKSGTIYQATVGLDISNDEVGKHMVQLCIDALEGKDVSAGYTLQPRGITADDLA